MGEGISHIQSWTDREVRTPTIIYRDTAWFIDIHAND
jgi:hypothetical protein